MSAQSNVCLEKRLAYHRTEHQLQQAERCTDIDRLAKCFETFAESHLTRHSACHGVHSEADIDTLGPKHARDIGDRILCLGCKVNGSQFRSIYITCSD